MNNKRNIGFWKSVHAIILIGTILLALGGANLPSVHAQDTTPGVSTPKPLVPHPFNFHKPVCPPSAKPGLAHCHSEVVTDVAGAPMASNSLLTGSYGPAAFRGAYGIGGTTATTRTVAIVDAYDNPTVLNDLDAYSDNFGIPRLNRCAVSTGSAASPCIQKVDQNGGTNYPAYNSGWAAEIALDVEIVHALCQNCNILLVEANDNNDVNLINAADARAYLMGANVVSNSWGGSEGFGENAYDTYFNHPGVAYVFSTGDSNYGVEYPAASPNVTAVGGTTLLVNSDYTYNSETVWSHNGSGTGSGCSVYEPKPSFQHDTGCTNRTVADVSADADPSTGAAVYITASGYSGWYQYGGTSLSAPLVAAVIAQAGGVGTTLGNSLPYANLNYGVNIRDVTSGSNGHCGGSYLCTAVVGYDGPTGLGSPLGASAFTLGQPSHTVTFNSNGGTGSMSSQTANVPTALTLNTFTRAGYSFSGWNTAADGSGTAYADGATYSFSGDITLYAQWSINSYSVTFNANGGTGSMNPQTGNYNTTAPLTLNTFTRTGYTFSGWNTLSGGGGTPYADGASYTFTASVTLYAQWSINSYTVTFNANGGTGSMNPQTGNYNTTAPLTLNAFTRTGYTFSGWNTLSGGGGTAYANGASYTFTASITLYAQWSINSYTVTFNANGGTGSMNPQTGIYNTTAPLALNAFARTGYTFSGWNTLSGGGGTAYADGASYTFTASITLYAQWTALPSHTITFNSNGGTGSMSPQTANVPTALTLNTFTRTGYTFSGWNTLSGGGGTPYADGASYTFTASVTLYAQWTALPSHTVTFNANGGTGSMSPQTANVPTALTLNTFTRSGYNFAGWNTLSGGGGSAYADGAVYSFLTDITLYAQWSINTYTVTYNANGGTGSMNPQTGIYNTTAPLALNTFTRTGYTFSGWNTLSSGGGTPYADGASYTFTASVTLYAQWNALPSHTVTFNANGGTGSMSPQTANVPTALTLNTFTRIGYNFAGWNTAANGSGTAYSDGAIYPFSADVTLYVQWTTLPTHTVTFNGNGNTGGSMSNQTAAVPTALALNSFTRTGYSFNGWNTNAGGTGTAYADGAIYPFSADTTLYAQWTALPSYSVFLPLMLR